MLSSLLGKHAATWGFHPLDPSLQLAAHEPTWCPMGCLGLFLWGWPDQPTSFQTWFPQCSLWYQTSPAGCKIRITMQVWTPQKVKIWYQWRGWFCVAMLNWEFLFLRMGPLLPEFSSSPNQFDYFSWHVLMGNYPCGCSCCLLEAEVDGEPGIAGQIRPATDDAGHCVLDMGGCQLGNKSQICSNSIWPMALHFSQKSQ